MFPCSLLNVFRRNPLQAASTPSCEQDVHDRLLPLLSIWAVFLNELEYPMLAFVEPRDERLPFPDTIYNSGEKYFTIKCHRCRDRRAWYKALPLARDLTDAHRKAVLTENLCGAFCFVFYKAAERLLQGLHDFQSLEWISAIIHPRRVYIWDHNLHAPHVVLHDFLQITLKDGSQYILDLTGPQFSIPGWLHPQAAYFQEYVSPNFLEIVGYHRRERVKRWYPAVIKHKLARFWTTRIKAETQEHLYRRWRKVFSGLSAAELGEYPLSEDVRELLELMEYR